MFQFSNLLTRQDAGAGGRRPSTADSHAGPSSPGTADEDSCAGDAGQFVSDRVRRDLDDQMQRLADLLDRVESQEFDREVESADIFSLAETERPDEPSDSAEPPRIIDDSEIAPETDSDFPEPAVTEDWGFDVYADEGATGDESAASSVLVPPVTALSSGEIERLNVPAMVCNSPGPTEFEATLAAQTNPPRGIETEPEAPAREKNELRAPATDNHKSDAGVIADIPLAVAAPPLAKETQSPALRGPSKLASARRGTAPPASTPQTSGLVQDFAVASRRVSLESEAALEAKAKPAATPKPSPESAPTREAAETPGCLTLAAPNFEESLASQFGRFEFPPIAEPTRDSGIRADESNANTELDAAQQSDALIQSCDHSRCDTPASAAAFPSRIVAPDFASNPLDPAGVHMLVVSDAAACSAPSSIQASRSSHVTAPARETHEAVTSAESQIDNSHRSLRRSLSIEPRRAGEISAPAATRSGKPQILNILAVIGGLLTLAALAYVASDLASWFGAP
jgi:hypothetical protein